VIEQGQRWSSLGMSKLYGRVAIHTSDPNASNSGYLFAGLLSVVLDGGVAPDTTAVDPLLPRIPPFFIGYMNSTTETLFRQFMTQGMGAFPVIAGYESQLIEYVHDHGAAAASEVRIIYPEPTVWAQHPFLALTPNGQRLLSALREPELQKLAWERHGSRPGDASVPVPTSAPVAGVQINIFSVADMPTPDVMSKILDAIKRRLPSPSPGSSPVADLPRP
jgi:hypothetical protein